MNKLGMYPDVKDLFSNAFHSLCWEALSIFWTFELSMYWDEWKQTQASIKYAAILNAQENK